MHKNKAEHLHFEKLYDNFVKSEDFCLKSQDFWWKPEVKDFIWKKNQVPMTHIRHLWWCHQCMGTDDIFHAFYMNGFEVKYLTKKEKEKDLPDLK